MKIDPNKFYNVNFGMGEIPYLGRDLLPVFEHEEDVTEITEPMAKVGNKVYELE